MDFQDEGKPCGQERRTLDGTADRQSPLPRCFVAVTGRVALVFPPLPERAWR